MSLRSLVLFATCLAAPIAFAQPAPTTAPATTQASVAADQSTPRGALKVLTVAMNKGDTDSIKAVFAPANPVEIKMVDAVISLQQSMLKFHAAAVTAFGADEARKLPPGDVEAAVAESLTALDKFPEQVTGDTATVGEGEQTIHLKKQGDKWILPVSMLAPQITADNVDQQLGQIGEQSKLLADMTDEVGKGKYKTADDAGKALQLKAMQAAMGHMAASQPATAPSGAPQGPGGL
jgi:hypothetical protein